jgi:hypothetical protein
MSVVEFLGIAQYQNGYFYHFNTDSTVNMDQCENIKSHHQTHFYEKLYNLAEWTLKEYVSE